MTRQTDGKSLYEQQEERILAQSDAFISLLTKRGILSDHQIDNEKVRKAQQEKNRKSYHNTQLLLQHYRNIAWLLECLPLDIAAELEEPFEGVDKLIDQMDLEMTLGNRKMENRMEGIIKSRLLFDRVNEALTVLKHKPGNGQRLYDVIYHTYIRQDKLSHQEILSEAIIIFQGKRTRLGSYKNFEDAVIARRKAEQTIFGEFLDSLVQKSGKDG